MKTLDRILNTKLIKTSEINKLQVKILKTYKKLGETNNSIDAINRLVEQYFSGFKQSSYYLNSLNKIVNDAIASGEYKRFSLLEGNLLKMSLHVMPKGTQIPLHAHPDMFSITFVDQGVLKIKKDSWGRISPLKIKDQSLRYSTLNANEVSTGLPIKNNLHQIQAGSDGTVFISLRVKSAYNHTLIKTLITKKNLVLSGVLMGLAMPFVSLTGTATSGTFSEKNTINHAKQSNKDYSKLVLASEKEQVYREEKLENHRIAAKFRDSSNYDNQVEAVKYYSKEAYNGDAESQYWLGVMFLDGSGTTEDDDLALDWLSKAAAQNYPPAEQLLAHLLATNFDMEC